MTLFLHQPLYLSCHLLLILFHHQYLHHQYLHRLNHALRIGMGTVAGAGANYNRVVRNRLAMAPDPGNGMPKTTTKKAKTTTRSPPHRSAESDSYETGQGLPAAVMVPTIIHGARRILSASAGGHFSMLVGGELVLGFRLDLSFPTSSFLRRLRNQSQCGRKQRNDYLA